MRTCLATFYPPPEDRLRFIKQLGIDDVIIWATTYQNSEDLSYKNLIALRNKIEDAGLSLFGLETLPSRFYDKVMLGKQGRDEQIKVYLEIIDNLGRAGIKTLGYN